MIIGVPKEIKNQEGRVGLTPAGVDVYVKNGHKVYVETGAGIKSGISDDDFKAAGAGILQSPGDVYGEASMIIKVKEPQPAEYDLLREDQILYTFLHLAPDKEQTEALLRNKVAGVAYETVQLSSGVLPLLAPMSEVAGRMSIQVGARLLEATFSGRGILLAGVTGVEKGNVVILGGGNVGISAIKMAVGLGADVTVIELSHARMQYLDDVFGSRIQTLASNSFNIAKVVKEADLVVGCVLVPGAKAPRLVSEEMVMSMRPGSVLVDVAIDQGGSIDTIDRITTHDNPYFVKHGVVHYSVANMPGAVPRTSTFALTNATLNYGLSIANKGLRQAMLDDPALLKGLNTYKGKVTYKSVADDQGLEYTPAESLL